MVATSDQPALRLPGNHRLGHDVVCELPPGVHATVGEVFAAARQRRSRIGFSTVYRALARLRDRGDTARRCGKGIAEAFLTLHGTCTRCAHGSEGSA